MTLKISPGEAQAWAQDCFEMLRALDTTSALPIHDEDWPTVESIIYAILSQQAQPLKGNKRREFWASIIRRIYTLGYNRGQHAGDP